MRAYDMKEWSDFFVAAAGGSAALAGLLFVAVSINIERILKFRDLPGRALVTLLLLLGALVAALFGLTPQSHTALGVELLAGGLTISIAALWVLIRSRPRAGEESHLASSLVTAIPGTVLYVVAGASLLAESGGGLYWVLAGIVGAVIGAALNAWVLLVEILR